LPSDPVVSGIVLDKAGHIVTNNHVVSGETAFTVTTLDGERYRARLVGSFPPDDLAVIKVSDADLKPASFADSSELRSAISRSRSATRSGCGLA
jgi:S1-C subfamily serine protease